MTPAARARGRAAAAQPAGGGVAGGLVRPRKSTMRLRVYACTDSGPGPTLYPKHGSHEAPRHAAARGLHRSGPAARACRGSQ
jgi:hypothetical protein